MGRTWRKRASHKRKKKLCVSGYGVLDNSVIQLLQWMVMKGLKRSMRHQMKPYCFSDTGRGLQCTKTLEEGATIIAVPENVLITSATVLDSYIGVLMKERNMCLSARQLLCVYLVYERYKGRESSWFYYIDTLPHSYDNIVNWEEEDVTYLPKYLQVKAKILCDEVKLSYSEIQSLVMAAEEAHPELMGVMNYTAYKWAWSTVNTRCIYMKQAALPNVTVEDQDNYALAPFLDLLNHSASAQVEATFNKTERHFEIITTTPYKKWSQVFICYGPHDNSKLLLEYGFLLPYNPHNLVKINQEDLENLDQNCNFSFYEEKIKLLDSQDLLRGLSINEDGLSWALTVAIKLLTLEDHNMFYWLQLMNGHTDVISDTCFKATSKKLIDIKVGQFNVLHTKSSNKQENSHQILAINLNKELMKILHDAMNGL